MRSTGRPEPDNFNHRRAPASLGQGTTHKASTMPLKNKRPAKAITKEQNKCWICGTIESKGWYRDKRAHSLMCDDCGDTYVTSLSKPEDLLDLKLSTVTNQYAEGSVEISSINGEQMKIAIRKLDTLMIRMTISGKFTLYAIVWENGKIVIRGEKRITN